MAVDYSSYDLETAKVLALSEVENWFSSKVQDVFDSDATGSMHRYWCDLENQTNMLNGALSRDDTPLMATPHPVGEAPTYVWTNHTPRQAGLVHSDYLAFRALSFNRYASLKSAVSAATTQAACEVIVNDLLANQ